MTIKGFDVLNRDVDVHRSYFLEASAGTGKTFSIENIIVRLLLEDHKQPPLVLEQILVVTFTRAAVRDLRTRIRKSIQQSLDYFLLCLDNPEVGGVADYLLAQSEKGLEAIIRSRRRLELALFCCDEAQIFTIHGFCARILRDNILDGDLSFSGALSEDALPFSQVLAIIRNFFRTEVRSEKYSNAQLKIILKEHGNDIEQLEKALARSLIQGGEIAEPRTFLQMSQLFKESMAALKLITGHLQAHKIVEDFVLLASMYKKSKHHKSEISVEFRVERFAKLFEQNTWSDQDFEQLIEDQLVYVEVLDPSLLKARVKPIAPENLSYPHLRDLLKKHLTPILQEASHPLVLFSGMAYECQKMLLRFMQEEEKLTPDDLLKTMLRGLQNEKLANNIRKRYCAVVIDEFQDTDPIQWQIFHTLFSSQRWKHGFLYLVGDPKQSIYAFRQADIYTYLAAAEVLGKDNLASLNTNYRSHPPLIKALNALFSKLQCPFILPRANISIDYRPVFSPPSAKEKIFRDELGSVHFCIVEGKQGRSKSWPTTEMETQYFFPFIAQEILRLTTCDGIALKQCAVLVRDRFQGERLADFFQKWNIPSISQRSSSLLDSPALEAIIEVLEGALCAGENQTRDRGALRKALGGKLIRWNHGHIRALQNLQSFSSQHSDSDIEHKILLERALRKFTELHNILMLKGFIPFFTSFMESSWHEHEYNIEQQILSCEDGEAFYADLCQIAEMLMEQESQTTCSPEQLLVFLQNLKNDPDSDQSILKRRHDPTKDAVPILTLHGSKGLEFDIVFALGLGQRSPLRKQLISVPYEDGHRLMAICEQDDKRYQDYIMEQDSEKMRLLYVGMTRAKFRLYVPFAISHEPSKVDQGEASPLDLLIARLRSQQNDDDLYAAMHACIQLEDGQTLTSFIDSEPKDSSLSYGYLNEQTFKLDVLAKKEEYSALSPCKSISIPGRQLFLHAFTSLAKSSSTSLISTPQNFDNINKTRHTLPSNSDIGNLFHEILEQLPFGVVKNMSHSDELIPLILSPIQNKALIGWQPNWNAVVADIIFHTLKVYLVPQDDSEKNGFCLCQLDLSKSYRELEFLFPWDSPLSVDGLSVSGGYLKGVIDLVFWHEGKYYLVDWKSNWLGPDNTYYNVDGLEAAMKAHNYDLQAAIYKEALKRYLSKMDERPFEECFGGMYYLFLRGLHLDHSSGIYKI